MEILKLSAYEIVTRNEVKNKKYVSTLDKNCFEIFTASNKLS